MNTIISDVAEDTDRRIREFKRQFPATALNILGTVNEKLQAPNQLKRGMALLFNQLKLMSNSPDCHQTFVEIVSTLGSWPTRFGYGRHWYSYVERAYDLSISYGMQQHTGALLLFKSETIFSLEKMDEALQFGLQAMTVAENQHRPRLLATSTLHVVTLYINKGKTLEAYDLVKRLDKINLINNSGDSDARLYLSLAFFEIYHQLGMVNESRDLIDQVETSIISCVDKHSLAIWNHNVGLFEWFLGNHKEAIRRYTLSKKLFAQIGDDYEIALISEIGLALWTMGQLREAEGLFIHARDLADRTLDYFRSLKAISNLALVYLSMGKVSEAYSLNEVSLNKAISLNYINDISRLTGNRGVIMIHLQNYPQALKDLEFDRRSHTDNNQQLCWILPNLGRLHRLLGNADLAYRYSHEALLMAREKEYRPREIIALRALAECTSSSEQAIQFLEEALSLAQGSQFLDEAACYLSLASLVLDDVSRNDYWDKGSNLLRHIGAERWLDNNELSSPPLIPLSG